MLADLLPPAASAAESLGPEPDPGAGLFPAEEALVRTADPRRRAEFTAGRACARTALARLGLPATPVLTGRAGEPRWPDGVTGSITHCAGYRACAVARTADLAGLGIDAEPDAGLPAGLIDSVTSGAERAWIARLAAAGPAVCWDRLLFSAKEAAGKFWYPLTGQWLAPGQVSVFPDPAGTFEARVAGSLLTGRWLARGGLILTAVTTVRGLARGSREEPVLRVTWVGEGQMTDTRKCEQCGTSFAPRREHARFCSARCRVAWNRQHVGDPPAEAGPLGWTITAMRDTIDRLLRARTSDQPHGFAAISEAVWWVTLVDATLVRYHPDVYDEVLEGYGAAERRVIEGTFGGLRFVRNWMGYHLDTSDFIEPRCGPAGHEHSPGAGPIAAWTWRSLPEPVLAALPERGREWEMTRYREYQARLADRPVGETFDRAAAFLLRASDGSAPVGPASASAVPGSPGDWRPGSATA